MKKIVLWALVITLAFSLVFSGCSKETTVGTDDKVTVTAAFPNADDTWKEDDFYKYMCDKLNMEIEFESLSTASGSEKVRIWIASGTMPDVVYTTSFRLDEYESYVRQGLIRKLPENWENDYPNVAFAMQMSGILKELKGSSNDGSVSVLLRPMDHYRYYIDDFRAAFKNGEDLAAMMEKPEYQYIDGYGFAYRKDWAQKLGIKTDYIMDMDDFMDMIRKFKEADFGGVGETNTVGLAVDYTEAPQVFMIPFNSSYKQFSKNGNGEYECGLLNEANIEGVKAYAEAFKTGILSPDFYTLKSSDLNSLFCSERSGAIFPRANVFQLRALCSEFEKSNPGKKAEDCIGVCWLRSPDGTVHGWDEVNYYGVHYFNPELSDKKMAKLLELADYISSEEGGPQVKLGIPDVDYKKEGDGYVVLREPDASGNLEAIDKKYPSQKFFSYFLKAFYDHPVDTNPYAMNEFQNIRKAKLAEPLSIRKKDIAASSYAEEDYVDFFAANDVNQMLADAIVSGGDPVEIWKKKISEIEDKAKSVADNMNKILLGK